MFKLTCELDDSYRKKINLLKEYFGVSTNSEVVKRMIDFFVDREKQDRLDKLELRVEELAHRIALIESRLK